MTTEHEEPNKFTKAQILDLLRRVYELLQFDIQWDIDEKVDGNDWRKMNIGELSDKLSEDFHYKLMDEYEAVKDSPMWKELESSNELDI